MVSISGLGSGAIVGFLLGLCGSLWLDGPARVPILAVLTISGCLDSTGHQRALGRNRETRYIAAHTQRWQSLASNAAMLATGFATRAGFASLYGLAVSTVLTSDPVIGLLVWGIYGLVRTGSVKPVSRMLQTRSPLDLFSYRQRATRLVGTITIAAAVLALVV